VCQIEVYALKGQKYFLVYEVSFLSLMAALVYVFKTFFKTPIQLPAHTAIVWVIPFIIGIGLTKKFGAGAYIGLISGLLMGTLGMADKGILEVFEWTAMGFTMDVLALMFRGHLGNPLVGIILGAFGSFDKTLVNYYIAAQITHSTPLLIAGIGVAGTSSLIFGGAGGIISVIIVNRVQHLHFPNYKATKSVTEKSTLKEILALIRTFYFKIREKK
jgi:hypothetical protein